MFCHLSKIMAFFLYGITDQSRWVENAGNPAFLKKQEKHINAAKSEKVGEQDAVINFCIGYFIFNTKIYIKIIDYDGS